MHNNWINLRHLQNCRISPPAKQERTLAAQTGSSKENQAENFLCSNNHYSDKIHKWNLLVILLIVLGQLCESFTYVSKRKLILILNYFEKKLLKNLLIRRSISLNLQINLLIKRWYPVNLHFSLTGVEQILSFWDTKNCYELITLDR